MEEPVKIYIKNMLSSELPEWDPSYEGVLLYDIENHRLLAGDAIGWVVIEEKE
jgi:hypothetical protein